MAEKLKVMLDLCMYEFEDIAWEDLCPSHDHTVPHPSTATPGGISGFPDTKPRHEVVMSTNSQENSADGYIYHYGEFEEFASLSERSKISNKDVFSSSMDKDSTHEASSVASEDMSQSDVFKSNDTSSNENGFCTNLDEKTATADKNSFSYPLGDATHAENNLDFGARDSGDLSYYEWPEIGNFEDVDRMFRSCDSTFGLEGSKDDGFGWLSSADEVGESKDEMESDARFTLSENEAKCLTNNDPAMTSAPILFNDDLLSSDKSQSYLSFVDGAALSNGKNGVPAKAQMINNRNQPKLQQHSGGKRKGNHPANGNFSYSSNLSNETTQVPSKATSHLDFSSGVMRPHQALSLSSFGYTPNHFTYTHSGSSCLPGPKLTNKAGASLSDSVKQGQLKFENNSDAEGGSPTTPAEFGSSIVSQAESLRTGDNSMEAASFRQLQLVMEQLDLKTKLCIRDSLYRLARSAEQRHNQANLCHNGDEMEGNGAFVAEDETNFIDMETQTNPIDRSVAHLLFHRAPGSSSEPSNSPSAVHGNTKADNVVICKGTASGNGEIG